MVSVYGASPYEGVAPVHLYRTRAEAEEAVADWGRGEVCALPLDGDGGETPRAVESYALGFKEGWAAAMDEMFGYVPTGGDDAC